MDQRRLLVLAFGALVLAAAGLAARPSEATVTATCPENVAGTLRNVSRSIVPIGVSVSRGFTVNPAGDATVSGIQLSAPPDFKAQQIVGNQAVVLRFTAPRAGSFVVQATWTVRYSDRTCTGSGSSTLNASAGTPLTVKPPPTETLRVVPVQLPRRRPRGDQLLVVTIRSLRPSAGSARSPSTRS